MSDEPMSGGGFIVPEYFASPEFLRSLLGMPPDTRTPEERKADRERVKAEMAAKRAKIEQAHAEIMATAAGLRRAVLEMHGPELGDTEWSDVALCRGCDWGGYEGEPPEFPCGTYELARDFDA